MRVQNTQIVPIHCNNIQQTRQNLIFPIQLISQNDLVEGDDGGDDLPGGQLPLPLLLPHQPPGQNVERESDNLETETDIIVKFFIQIFPLP